MKRPHIQAISAGMLASFSIAAGYLPIAFSFGVAAVQAGLDARVAVLTSLLVYAGASQFLLISLLAAGAGLWTALPTVLLMNARHMLYGPALVAQNSASAQKSNGQLASHWLAFGLTDEVFATAMSKQAQIAPEQRDLWLLGLQLGAYATWVGGTVLGVSFVREVANWPSAVRDGLDFVLPALFFALLLETGIRRWRVPVLIAAVTALGLGFFLKSYHALALAIVAGALGQGIYTHRTTP